METLKVTLGIDSSKDNCVCNLSKLTSELEVKVITTKTFANTEGGNKESLTWVKKYYHGEPEKLNVVIEATGVYHERFALGFQEAGFRVSVVLPNKAKKYMESVGIKTKNDHIDARGLARMGMSAATGSMDALKSFLSKVTYLYSSA